MMQPSAVIFRYLIASSSRLRMLALGITIPTLVTSACGPENPQTAARPDSAGKVSLAQPCDALKTGAQNATPATVFLQLASVQSTLAEPLGDYLKANPVQVGQVASMLIRAGKPAMAPWRSCAEGCTTEENGTIEATLSGPNDSQLELTVRMPGKNPERALVTITDQTPGVVPLTGASNDIIVATPYLIPEPEQQGLQTLYDCKVQARER